MKLLAHFLLALILSVLPALAKQKEASYCAEWVSNISTKLPKTVMEQRQATKKISIEKATPGDYIFFDKDIENCPNGFSGIVMDAGVGYIVFGTGVATPREQVILLPAKLYKGNFWYKQKPEIRADKSERL